MRPFKFFSKEVLPEVDLGMVSREVQMIARGQEYIPAGYVNVNLPTNRYGIIMEGWRAHRDNLSPGQCPYVIGTPERERWMTGWSQRENNESNTQH